MAKEKKVHENHKFAVVVKKEVNVMLEEREKAIAQGIEENKKVIREIQAQEEMA